MRHAAAFLVLSVTMSISASAAPQERVIGERPFLEAHMDQSQIDRGRVNLKQLFEHGKLVFDARFNALDGRGRPFTIGNGVPRANAGPDFIRTSGPDANSCMGCHNMPRSGGGGDFVVNVFVLAQTLDPVTESVSGQFSNERNTLGMMGSGPIEMLAREMTSELIAIRTQAQLDAANSNQSVTRDLIAKGVDFGRITVLPNGKVDPTEIDGVDWDLIVKPFHQKGAVVSLREFTNNAMNHHHGMQPVERFGANTDPDGDGVANELTIGDVTAASVYQAALNTPVQVMPQQQWLRKIVKQGDALFGQIGCTQCHMPEFTLNDRFYSEPNPFNPVDNLRPDDVSRPFRFDMTSEGEKPRLERASGGRAIIRPFTDLKRHDLNDADFNHFANEQVPQGSLIGFAPASDFTIAPQPRPVREFLTRKLWDVGNSDPYGHRGDLTTMTEAIYYHGGEGRTARDNFFALPQEDRDAIIEFLKTLQIVPPKGEGNGN